MNGPYETEREAIDATRHIYDQPAGEWTAANRQMLLDACHAAGVELGAYDKRILGWLAGYEAPTCAVIAGLISRAANVPAPAPRP